MVAIADNPTKCGGKQAREGSIVMDKNDLTKKANRIEIINEMAKGVTRREVALLSDFARMNPGEQQMFLEAIKAKRQLDVENISHEKLPLLKEAECIDESNKLQCDTCPNNERCNDPERL